MENRLDTELLRSRFAELSGLCNELEKLVTEPQKSRSELQVALVRLKNQLRLIEIATSGQILELSTIRRFRITGSELFILMFHNKDQFLNKALKGDTKSIIECTSAIKSSISLWETRILRHLDSKANGSVEGKQQVVGLTGKQLRRRILRYLLDRERIAGSSLPGLDEIARDLGVGKSDVDDQLDILDSLGAIKANRTFGGAAPMLTGSGKALLEELEQESLSTRESRYALGVSGVKSGDDIFEWDVFISHATEDKDVFVRQLAKELGLKSLRVWYDEFTLRVGDSLRQSIEKGLAKSRYGIVVLSPNFFAKKWPQDELNGLAVRERRGEKVILPVWLNVDEDYIVSYSPILADRVAAKASDRMAKVISDLLAVIRPSG
jgi:DNA-binding MarR family transcriptional regulator